MVTGDPMPCGLGRMAPDALVANRSDRVEHRCSERHGTAQLAPMSLMPRSQNHVVRPSPTVPYQRTVTLMPYYDCSPVPAGQLYCRCVRQTMLMNMAFSGMDQDEHKAPLAAFWEGLRR